MLTCCFDKTSELKSSKMYKYKILKSTEDFYDVVNFSVHHVLSFSDQILLEVEIQKKKRLDISDNGYSNKKRLLESDQ